MILELKVDHTPEEALEQIKNKNYKIQLDKLLFIQYKLKGRYLK